MKATRVFLGIVVLTVLAGVVSVIRARSKHGEILHMRAQFEQLKSGDRIVYVCRQCDGEREVVLNSDAAALEHYREGSTIICPGCNHKMKVVVKRTPGAPGSADEIRYFNEKGHECLTVAKARPRQ